MDLDDLTTAEKVGVGGGALAVVGAFLPWVSAGPFSASGLDGDGMFTLLFGIVAGGVILMRNWEQVDQIGVGVLGLFSLAVGGNVYSDLGSVTGGSGSTSLSISLSPGIGLYLTLLAGLLMIASAVLGYQNAQQSRQDAGLGS